MVGYVYTGKEAIVLLAGGLFVYSVLITSLEVTSCGLLVKN